MADEVFVTCPYCGADVEILLESDVRGELVLDCEVCCNPWSLRVSGSGESRRADVSRADGSD